MLAGFEGAAARDLESRHRALLDDKRVARKPIDTADAASRTQLRAECERRVSSTLLELGSLARTVPSNVLLGVPLLLGQADIGKDFVSPGPNQFDLEIELLSSSASAPPEEPDLANVDAALRCMALARAVRLMSQAALMTRHEDNALGHGLAIGWLFERGRFSGYYDLQVADLVALRLRGRGLEADSPMRCAGSWRRSSVSGPKRSAGSSRNAGPRVSIWRDG